LQALMTGSKPSFRKHGDRGLLLSCEKTIKCGR
jgi:hypothetical protein